MELYHGTNYESAINIIENGIDLLKGKAEVDFGSGFYTTTDFLKAQKRALFKAKNEKEKACVVVLEVDETRLNALKVKRFDRPDCTWGEFVLHNRMGSLLLKQCNITTHNLDQKYDLVIGEIADGKVSSIVYQVKKGELNVKDVNFDDFLTDGKGSYGIQVSFHTLAALSCIKTVKCDKITVDNEKGR